MGDRDLLPGSSAALVLGRGVRGHHEMGRDRRARGVQPVRLGCAGPSAVGAAGDRRVGRWGHFESVFDVEPPPYRAVLQSRVVANYSPVRMRPGDVIHSADRISEYFEREGKMGLQLYTTISVDYFNQHDEWIKRLDTVFVRYR